MKRSQLSFFQCHTNMPQHRTSLITLSTIILLLLLLLLLLLPPSQQTNEVELVRHLLRGNAPYSRPIRNTSHPVNVTFGLELIHLLSVQETKQTIQVSFEGLLTFVKVYIGSFHAAFQNKMSNFPSQKQLPFENQYFNAE